MRFAQQTVSVVLNEAGKKVLQALVVTVGDKPAATMYVQDTDELGIWIRAERPDGPHLVLVRWDFVMAIDIVAGQAKTFGIKP